MLSEPKSVVLFSAADPTLLAHSTPMKSKMQSRQTGIVLSAGRLGWTVAAVFMSELPG
jgi:hypothetical protein